MSGGVPKAEEFGQKYLRKNMAEREGATVTGAATWGFRPKWLSEYRKAPINARAERAATTPMVRSAFRRGRCLG